MKVSPLETRNKYNVLVPEETKDNGSHPTDSLVVTYYTLKFLTKLRRRCLPKFARVRGRPDEGSQNSISRKTPKSFIRSAQIEKEVTVKVAVQTVDTHAKVEVDALLDSGATGLFINRALVRNNAIPMRKLEHPITVYNIDGTEN